MKKQWQGNKNVIIINIDARRDGRVIEWDEKNSLWLVKILSGYDKGKTMLFHESGLKRK